MLYKDYYMLLEVARTATQEEITKSFKRLARMSHPDLNPGGDGRIKDLNEAHAVLRDPAKRAVYDAFAPGLSHGERFSPSPGFEVARVQDAAADGQDEAQGFSDFFRYVFTGTQPPPAPPVDDPDHASGASPIRATLEITPLEAATGATRVLTVSRKFSGKSAPPTLRAQTLSVTIPPGVHDGTILRLAGHPQPDASEDTDRDVLVRIQVRHAPREGIPFADLEREVPFGARVGTRVSVEPQGLGDTFHSRIVGWKPDKFIILELPNAPRFKDVLHAGKAVVIRYLTCQGHVNGFRSLVQGVATAPERLAFIDFPAAIERISLRGAPRVYTYLPAVLTGENLSVPGHIVDLSATGCKFGIDSGSSSFLVLDDDAPLALNFDLLEGDLVRLRCAVKVKRIYRFKGMQLVGLEFLNPDELLKQTLESYSGNLKKYFRESCLEAEEF